ncbi:transposase domain-containing protein [Holdemanella biformis]
MESAKMNKLNPEKYLEYVLDTLSTKGLTDKNIESVLSYSNKLPKNLYVK